MPWQFTPLTLPLLVAAFISFSLGAYVAWWGRDDQADRVVASVLAMTLLAGFWSSFYALQLASETLTAKLFWSKLVTVGAQGVTVSWLAFVFAYTGRESWLRPRRFGVFVGLFVITLLLDVSDPVTGIYFSAQRVVSNGEFRVLVDENTIVGLAVDPLYLLLVGGSLYLLYRYITGPRNLYRGQALALALTPVAPMIAYLAHLFRVGPYPRVNLAPLGFAITSVLIAYAIVRYRFLDLTPVVRDKVVENMEEGYAVVDDGTIIDHNRAAAALLDTESDLMGTSIDSVLDASIPGDATGQTERILDAEQGDRHLSVRVSELDTEHADHLVLLRDVTERRLIERRYQALIERASDLTAIINPDGSIDYVSPAVSRLLGYSPAEIEGQQAIDLVAAEDKPLVAETFSSVLGDEQTSDEIEFRVTDDSGDTRVLEAVFRDLRGEPAVEGLVLNAWEVTERKARTEKLAVLNRILRHDIRNEMQVIDGKSRLLSAHVDDEGQEHLDGLQSSAAEVVDLTEKVRDLMATMTQDGLDVTPTEVTPIVEREVERLSVPEDGTVTVQAPDEECPALANEMLSSVFRNLLENALKHTDHDAPEVTVTVSCVSDPPGRPDQAERVVDSDSGYVVVRVADNGPGIPEERRDAVFGRGEQGIDSEGTGVGLYLVRTLIESYGGEVWIETNDPRGSVFVVVLLAAGNE